MAGHQEGAAAPAADSGLPQGRTGAWTEDLPSWHLGQLSPTLLPPEGHVWSRSMICMALGVKQLTNPDSVIRSHPARKVRFTSVGQSLNHQPAPRAALQVPVPSPRGHLHGGAHGEKQVETSASVCLRPVLPDRGFWASRSSSRPGPCLTSSLMDVSSRPLGEMERCRNTPLQLASRGKSKGCKGTDTNQ